MKKMTLAFLLLTATVVQAQDDKEKKAVKIFHSEKAINANTTETVGKGKMAFKVSHSFGDIAGKNGGIKPFFGLDNSTDVRIGFQVGVSNKVDLVAARAKGASLRQQLWEMGVKWKLMEQREDDPSHPLSVALYANAVIAANKANAFPNQENSYADFSDRLSHMFQLILARKIGKVSVQLNPTLVTRGYAISYDQQTIFALGGALRFPLVENRLNLLVDYFHPFRKETVENDFQVNDNIRFYDPLGVGFEFITSGHHFRLNFVNNTEILENRLIPRTITSWGKGQFRWAFTISRNFNLWR